MAMCVLCGSKAKRLDSRRAADDLGQPVIRRVIDCPTHGPRRQTLADDGEASKRYVDRESPPTRGKRS